MSLRDRGTLHRLACGITLTVLATSCSSSSDENSIDGDTPATIQLAPPAPRTEPIITTTTTIAPTTTTTEEVEEELEEDEEAAASEPTTTRAPRVTNPPATAPQTTTTVPTTDPETGETIVPVSVAPTAFERPIDRGTIEWDFETDETFGNGCSPGSDTSLSNGDWAGFVSNITDLTLVFDVVCVTYLDGADVENENIESLELPVSSNVRALDGDVEIRPSEFASASAGSVVFIRVRDGVVTLMVKQQL